MEKTNIAAAFMAANEKKAAKMKGAATKKVDATDEHPDDAIGNKLLVDVGALIGGVVQSPEQLEAQKKIALQNAEWAKNAAEGLVKIRAQIKGFEEMIAAGGVLNAAQHAHLEKLREAEKQILDAGDAAIKEHRQFAEFLAEIRAAAPDLKKAEEFVRKAILMGRYRKASEADFKMIQGLMKEKKSFPQGLVYLNGINYLSNDGEGGVKSKAQMALESELTRFVREAVKLQKKIEEEGVNLDLRGLQQGKEGKYKIIFEDRIGENNKQYYAGEGIVQILFKKMEGRIDQIRVIVPVKGYGSLKSFSKLAENDFWVPVSWYGLPNLEGKKISDEVKEDAEKFLRTLKAGVAAFYNREKGGDQ